MRYILILTALIVSGCVTPGKTTKEGSETMRQGLETQGEILESQPLIKGDNNNIEKIEIQGQLPQAKRDISATSASDLQSSYSLVTSISMGLNLILLGLGIILLKMSLKGSKAASATMGLIDNGIAKAVAMASSSKDDREIGHFHNLRAELESIKKHL